MGKGYSDSENEVKVDNSSEDDDTVTNNDSFEEDDESFFINSLGEF